MRFLLIVFCSHYISISMTPIFGSPIYPCLCPEQFATSDFLRRYLFKLQQRMNRNIIVTKTKKKCTRTTHHQLTSIQTTVLHQCSIMHPSEVNYVQFFKFNWMNIASTKCKNKSRQPGVDWIHATKTSEPFRLQLARGLATIPYSLDPRIFWKNWWHDKKALHVSEAQGSRRSCTMEHGFCKVCPPHLLINWLHPFPLFIKVHWYRKKDTHFALFFLYGPLNNLKCWKWYAPPSAPKHCSQWDSCNFRRDTCFRRWSQSHLFVSILAFNETPTPRKSFTLSPSICSCPFLPV